jgi:hypothetical protein
MTTHVKQRKLRAGRHRIKFKPCERNGEHLMMEARLIDRLRPSWNSTISAGIRLAQSKGVICGRPQRTDVDGGRLAQLRAEGYSFRAIAKMTGVPVSTVVDWFSRCVQTEAA